jgi:hypothetical protein
MTIPREVIRSAWAAEKQSIEKNFLIVPVGPVAPATEPTQAANAIALPDLRSAIQNPGLCPNASQAGSWKAEGDTVLTLSDLKVWSLTGVKAQDATFPDDTTVVLPVQFAQMEVRGRFHIHCVCVMHALWTGHEVSRAPTNETGAVVQAFGEGTLGFVVDASGARLTFKSVTVPANPSVTTRRDSGMPPWMQQFANVMSGRDILGAINQSMGNVFASAAFTQTMIANLNKNLGL